MDGMLSQEEINALLNGIDSENSSSDTDTSAGNASSSNAIDEALTPMERDMMGEISNISMGTAATTLSSLVNQKVDITTPKVELSTWQDLVAEYDRPCVFIQISYKEGINGNNVFILKDTDVKVIADLMMGGDGTNIEGQIGELHLSAICEAMNQMMGSASTSLSSMLGIKIDISPPTANIVDLNDDIEGDDITDFLSGDFVKISFKMTVGDLVDSEIMQLYPVEFCKTLCNKLGMGGQPSETTGTSEPEPEPVVSAAPQPQETPTAPVSSSPTPSQQPVPDVNMNYGMPMQGMPMQGMPYGYGMPMQGMPYGYGMPMQQAPVKDVNVSPASFQPFQADVNPLVQQENIDLIMDVPLEVTVELGRVSKSIKDILDFAPGTIVELNKIAGEAVDVLVNGKYVAKGEVVVIEENFGVRITEIIK